MLFRLRQHLLDLGFLRAIRIGFQKGLPSGDRGFRVRFALPLEVAEIEEDLGISWVDSQSLVEHSDAAVQVAELDIDERELVEGIHSGFCCDGFLVVLFSALELLRGHVSAGDFGEEVGVIRMLFQVGQQGRNLLVGHALHVDS